MTATLLREGEQVDVLNGAFAGMWGIVRSVDPFAGRVVVEVPIYGRPVPVELSFAAVRRAPVEDR